MRKVIVIGMKSKGSQWREKPERDKMCKGIYKLHFKKVKK